MGSYDIFEILDLLDLVRYIDKRESSLTELSSNYDSMFSNAMWNASSSAKEFPLSLTAPKSW